MIAILSNRIYRHLFMAQVIAAFAAAWLWPRSDPQIVEHSHEDLPSDHPHWAQGSTSRRARHAHPFIVDDLHTAWPAER